MLKIYTVKGVRNIFFFSSRRRHTRLPGDWSSDVCSSDLGSARYFFANMRKSKDKGRQLGGGELVSIAVQTAVVDVLASGEFCSTKRRLAHLLGMYGFVLYLVATAVMVFRYPTGATPQIWPMLWWIGALMVLVGGYWFWFFIRVDVVAEGHSPFRVARADLFVLSLLASVTLGVAWAVTGGGVGLLFWLYILATIVLFGGVPWSKSPTCSSSRRQPSRSG